ncbi:MAG: hypothetical protein AABX82_07505, partial [Nanoarchaeota archaeon]
YNLRKERQINCMYTTCLEENAKNGLPIDICDVQYKERECLYVDGAVWLALDRDWFGHFVELMLNTFLSNLDILLLSIGYYLTCGWFDFQLRDYSYASIAEYQTPAWMWAFTGCHVAGAGLTLAETNWFTDTVDWDFEANLEGTDYCAGY